MSQAPLPPHERTWRHPSELAAAEREEFRTAEVSPATRAMAVVTGTMGLLAVGMLVLTAAPERQPVAVGATTTPVAVEAVVRSGIAAIGRFASDDDDAGSAMPERNVKALATPVGDGRSAVLTRRSVAGEAGDALDVQLTSGAVVTAQIIDETATGAVVVTIEEDDPGHEIAAAVPDPDDIVTVLVDPPVTIAFADIASVGAAEGTPVLDAAGQLVGLCTRGHAGIVDLTTEPATTPSATPSTAPPSGPPTVSAEPASATSAAP